MLTYDGLVSDADEGGGGPESLCFRPLTPEISVQPTLIWKREQKLSLVSQLFIDKLESNKR